MDMTASRAELLVDGSDQVLRQAIQDALEFSVRLQDLRNGLGQSAGLSGPAYSILVAIDHLSREEEIGVNVLSEHLHWSGAFVTTEVNKLVAAGLIDKAPHPTDKRRVLLRVTSHGSGLLQAAGDLHRSVNDAIFSDVGTDELRSLAGSLAKLVEGAQDALAILHLHARRRRKTA